MGCIRLRSGEHMKMTSFRRALFFELFYRISYSFRISKKSKTPARGQGLYFFIMQLRWLRLFFFHSHRDFYLRLQMLPRLPTILGHPGPLLRPPKLSATDFVVDCCASCIPIQLVSFLITCSPCSISSCTSVSQLSAYPSIDHIHILCLHTPTNLITRVEFKSGLQNLFLKLFFPSPEKFSSGFLKK
jgi:hypothetical protein